MRKDGEPQVWGEGDLTIALSTDGFRVWVGTQPITHVTSIKLHANSGAPEIELQFSRDLDPQEQLKIEQSTRTAKMFPWIRVV
jgi:hypothetical protein